MLLLLISKPTQIPEHVANGNGGGGAAALRGDNNRPTHSVGKNERSKRSAPRSTLEYLMTTYITSRVRPLNLGWCFLPSKVALYTPFFGCLWTNLAKFLVDF